MEASLLWPAKLPVLLVDVVVCIIDANGAIVFLMFLHIADWRPKECLCVTSGKECKSTSAPTKFPRCPTWRLRWGTIACPREPWNISEPTCWVVKRPVQCISKAVESWKTSWKSMERAFERFESKALQRWDTFKSSELSKEVHARCVSSIWVSCVCNEQTCCFNGWHAKVNKIKPTWTIHSNL